MCVCVWAFVGVCGHLCVCLSAFVCVLKCVCVAGQDVNVAEYGYDNMSGFTTEFVYMTLFGVVGNNILFIVVIIES